MKDSIKDEIKYVLLSTIVVLMLTVVGIVSLVGWNHMTPKEREEVLIIMFMSDH